MVIFQNDIISSTINLENIMDKELRGKFISQWQTYFPNAELPVTFQYSDDSMGVEKEKIFEGQRCIFAQLAKVRRGESICMQNESVNCRGGKRYLGFSQTLFPGFECFLSHDEAGEGERYKRTPELVTECMKHLPFIPVKKNIIFKRWDRLTEEDAPMAVIFFANPDVISGLFTLACFNSAAPDAVITPFGAGCASIVYYPYREQLNGTKRAVLGLFDPSARKCVKGDLLTFAIPFSKFVEMINEMEESFLITNSWSIIKGRMGKVNQIE